MFFHLPQEQQYGYDKRGKRISEHPPQVWEDIGEIACESSALHLYSVNERKRIGYLLESTAYQLKVEPSTRQPCRKVCQQGSAYSADLLIVQNTAEQQSESDEKDADRYNEKNGKEDIDGNIKPENDSNNIANNALRYSERNDRQSVSEDEIKRCQRRCVKSLKQRAAPVLRDKRCREQRHK